MAEEVCVDQPDKKLDEQRNGVEEDVKKAQEAIVDIREKWKNLKGDFPEKKVVASA